MKKIFIVALLCFFAAALYGQEKSPSFFLLPAGYDYIRFENQTIHKPAVGAGFLLGEQNLPFNEVERRFFGMALYQPFFLSTQ
jgi:hypothetical protein